MKKLLLSCLAIAATLACVDPPPPPPPPPLPGWSVVPTGRALYVSEAHGLDTNPGTEALPFKTFAPGLNLINAGKADSLLFNRGETFHNTAMKPSHSGTAAQPVVFGAYGTGDRPVLLGGGINIYGTPVSHIAVLSLHFQGTPGSGSTFGVRNVAGNGTDALIEDCFIEKYVNDIGWDSAGGGPTAVFSNLRIRRNVLTDATSLAGVTIFTQGLYVSLSDNVLIEENFFDHNGYNGPKADTNSIFNHHVYYQTDNTSNVKFLNNVVTRGADGVQLRPGGVATGNFFYDNAIGLTMRQEQGPSLIDSNVFLNAGDISAALPRGFGISFDTTHTQLPTNAVTVSNNIFAFITGLHPNWGAAITASNNPTKMTISNNSIWSFGPGIVTKNSPNAVVTGTNVGPFKDVSRSLKGYLGMTPDQFYAKERLQNKLNWDLTMGAPALNAWVKAGFTK